MVEKDNVLIIEDDGILAMGFEADYKGMGFEPVYAPSAERAEALLTQGRTFPFLHCDDGLGSGMPGREFYRRFRARDATTPFLMVSSMNPEEGARLGANDPNFLFIQKPVRPGALEDAVGKFFPERRNPAQPRTQPRHPQQG